ncbi:conserved hypothetical protein [Histoplasma capsulatum var. duboisii H88]|uniref:Uncharacterized protein n=1 Tax=Ajellomyces capsulatus (strain H88) TaxID=544711 RepID=F0UNI4_AJEC8|nr:conserved hypothetical protein [Histoplasma capsulatum var. duboisii H88]QSS52964.1 hypothetical protein I7I53_00060 [Histoplasma capsulatum var. duboisii H88]
MQSEIKPFHCPEHVGRLMAGLFCLYISYSPDSFPFEWLQKTEDLKVQCRDSTREKVTFSTSPELLQAIHRCERVTAPEKTHGLPSDWGFSGFMKTAAHQVLDEVPFTKAAEFEGPFFRRLGIGIISDSHPRIKGEQIFYLCHNHWSCIIRDRSITAGTELRENRKDYLLKSELLAVTSIFYRQMNEMVWLPEENRYMPKPIYKEGFLVATIVTFVYGKVRIVQATCDPSERNPTLTLTLRAVYNLGKDNYDKRVAFDILKWIFCPPEPARELAISGK